MNDVVEHIGRWDMAKEIISEFENITVFTAKFLNLKLKQK